MKRLYCDGRLCVACHACEVACAVEHSDSRNLLSIIERGEFAFPRRLVQTVGSDTYRPAFRGVAVSTGCQHCLPAPCVDACISGAMHKDGDVTECNTDHCVGCWMCLMACPFGAITPTDTAWKCDLCPERAHISGRGRYACVEACPTEALLAREVQSHNPIDTG
jgi:anaerobic carbon-monoxide dehydrogenase iron sulfur subunit